MKTINVVAAIIRDGDGRVFCTQRGYGEWKDWWEFPGGKIEPGETSQEALKREIREELDTEIEVGELLTMDSTGSPTTVEYDYPKFHPDFVNAPPKFSFAVQPGRKVAV